jgi:hypothetical protein
LITVALCTSESRGAATVSTRFHVPAHQCAQPAGQKITVNADMSLNVPDQPIVPYIEGDGTGWTSRR